MRSISESVFEPRRARVLRATPLTRSEIHCEVALEEGSLGALPGQFVQVTLPGVGECPISICSDSRSDGRFELCIRQVGLVTTAIHRLRVGDVIGIRGPFGRGFPVDRVVSRDILFVAGGLGMAPLRSMVQHVLNHRSRYGEVTLVYGTRSPADLLFRDEVYGWHHGGSMRVVLTVDLARGDWGGIVGPVTVPLRSSNPVPERTAAFVVGPPVMFRYVLEVLRQKRLPDDWIWCSFERRMYCGIGKCGQCQMEDLLTCKDGPVLSLAELEGREHVL